MTPKDWYRPGPRILDFHMCKDHKIRVLMGGRGCGKTFASMMEAVWHCWYTKGARVRVFRKWGSSNEDSVKDTLMEVFKNMGELFVDTGRTLFSIKDGGSRFRVPSQHAVDLWVKWRDANPDATISQIETWLNTVGERYCGHIIMDGLPDADKANAKTRSNQCSMMIFVEADQIEESFVNMGIGSVRLPDADGDPFPDYNIIIESNPPNTKHWLAKWEHGDDSDPANPRKPREQCKFWHIPTEDNVHNVPGGREYLEGLKAAYAHSPDEYARFVMGEYADVFPGEKVIKTFDPRVHIAHDLGFPAGATLIRGWDYGGSNNACLWMAYFVDGDGYEHLWALRELWLQNSSIEEQATRVLEITRDEFPDIRDRSLVNAVYDFGDIAGTQRTATGSVSNVLATFGIYPGVSKMGLQESLSVVLRMMSSRDAKNRPLFLVDAQGCPKLVNALKGEYRYPLVHEPGYGAAVQEPLKGPACNNADHICFVEGTKITTQNGERDIKDVNVGDMVLTRDGFKRVSHTITTHNQELWKLTTNNGKTLTGTKNHPIWVRGMGFVPLNELKTSYYLQGTEENYTDYILNNHQVGTLNGTTNTYTGKYGKIEQVKKYLKDIMSIISTTTNSIINLKIWNLFSEKNTLAGTTKENQQTSNISRTCKYLPKNGTVQKKVKRGIATILKRFGKIYPYCPSHVKYAEQNSNQSYPGQSFADLYAKQKISAGSIQVTSVEKLNLLGTVYNITVEDKHEYYANGILVSNCDCLRYGVTNMFRLLRVGTTGPIVRKKVNPVKIPR